MKKKNWSSNAYPRSITWCFW